MTVSLRAIALDFVANNFDLYEEDPKLLKLPSDVSNELLNKLLKNPGYKPTEKTLPLAAREIDLANVDSVHQDAKIRYVFEKCRKGVVKLTLPRDFFRTFVIRRGSLIASVEEIKNPIDAWNWFFHTAIPELVRGYKLPERHFCEVALGDSLFEKLKVLNLQPRKEDQLTVSYEFCIDAINSLAKLCPSIEELHLSNWIDGFHFENFARKIKSLSVDNDSSIIAFEHDSLDTFIGTNTHIENLYLRNCDTALPKSGLSELRSLIIVGGNINNLSLIESCYPKLEMLMLMENQTDRVFSLKSSTVKVRIIDKSPVAQNPFQLLTLEANLKVLRAVVHEIKEFCEPTSKKLADLTRRISDICENIRKQDASEAKERLLTQLTDHEKALKKAEILAKQTTFKVKNDAWTEFSLPTHLVNHIHTIRDIRDDLGAFDDPILLDEMITPEIFKVIVDLITILHPVLLEKPEDRNDLLDIALSKTPKGHSFPLTKDNWILLYQASNYLGCNVVSRLCTDFAERNVNLADFKPEDRTNSQWAYFVKNLSEKFLNKMVDQFLDNTEALGDQFSLFGPSIKKLDLSKRKNINQDELNKLLERCPHLEELNLTGCKQITEIPEGLTRLKILNLDGTGITQAAVNKLPACCPHLEELNLSWCIQITDIPEGLTRLKILNLDGTGITQAAVNKLPACCSHLEELNLTYCEQITEIPEGFTRLKILNIYHTGITQAAVNKLPARCPHLEELNLSWCIQITEIPEGFTRLKILNICHTGITQAAVNKLPKCCPHLEELNLSWCIQITEIPEGFTCLKILNLDGTGITQAAVNKLPACCPHLEELNLSWCIQITEIPEGFTRLKILNIYHTGITQAAVNKFPKCCPHLEELNLSLCIQITEIPEGFTCLKILDLYRTGITQAAVNKLPKCCPHLEELNLSWCIQITEIPEGFTCLKILDLYRTGITQAAVNKLPKCCPHLEKLNLRDCKQITDIPEGFTCLKILDLYRTGITQAAVNKLPKCCPHLEKLNLRDCKQITDIPEASSILKIFKWETDW